MAKLKFKDENDNFISVVQDVKINNNSVFDGKEADINLKTINNTPIVGNGNISIDQDFVKDNNYVHTDNNYTTAEKNKLSELENYDDTEIKQDITDLDDNKADKSDIPDVSSFITKDVNNLTNYTLKTNTGSLIDLEINDTTYVVTLKLKNQDGTVISTDTIDLPLENVVVSGSYDEINKKIVLTLQSGDTVNIPVGALISGLQSEITSSNKLASDLIDDSNSGNKFVTTSEKQTWNNKLDTEDLTDYVKNTDYATDSKGGVVKTGAGLSLNVNGTTIADTKTYAQYNDSGNVLFIGKGTLENVITGKELVNKTYVDNIVGDIESLLAEV